LTIQDIPSVEIILIEITILLGLESPNMEEFKKIKLLIIESNSVDAEALMDIFGDVMILLFMELMSLKLSGSKISKMLKNA
jgi:hypothetical protein